MKITILTLGKFKSQEYFHLLNDYIQRTRRFTKIEHVELMHSKASQDSTLLDWLDKQKTERIYFTVLDEAGTCISTIKLVEHIQSLQTQSYYHWVVALGSAHGYGQEVKNKAHHIWSLSPLTMAHELASVVVSEQIYRAYTIIHHHPYHNT